MARMFDNYDKELTPPDNLFKFLRGDERDVLTVGATNVYYFRLPVATDDIEEYVISFKQGLSIILEKGTHDGEFEEYGDEDKEHYIRCELSPEDSKLFNNGLRETTVQLAILLLDNSVVYSDKYILDVEFTTNSNVFGEEE